MIKLAFDLLLAINHIHTKHVCVCKIVNVLILLVNILQKLLYFISQTKISETEAEYNSMKSSTSDLSKQLVKLNSDKLDSEQEVAELASKLKENSSALHKVNSELQSLKLEDIPYENENEKQKLKEYTNEELAVFKEENLLYKSSVLHGDLKKSQPNMQAIEV